ncbi:hypothetical protein ABPG75_013306 [Micractinium tetrahymenae]
MLRGSPRRPVGILATRRQPPAPPQRRPSWPLLAAAASLFLLASSGVVLFRHLGAGSLPEQKLQPAAGASSSDAHRSHRELREHSSRPTNTLSREAYDSPDLSSGSSSPGSHSKGKQAPGSGGADTGALTAVDGSGGGDSVEVTAPGSSRSSSSSSGGGGEVTAPGSSGGTGTGFLGTASGDAHLAQQPAGLPTQPPVEPLSEAELHGGWKLSRETFDHATRHPNATVVSWASPRVLLIRDFLTPDEIEHLVALAEGGYQRSEVISDDAQVSSARTSSGVWLSGQRRDDKVLEVQHRMHDLLGIPEPFGESIYVLRYGLHQRYDVHTDHCSVAPGDPGGTTSCHTFLQRAGGPACGPGGGGVTCGDRLATFILYLRSPERGGSTVFPLATHYIKPQVPATPEPGASGASEAAASVRRTLVDVTEAQPEQTEPAAGAAGGGSSLEAELGVPEYCRQGAPFLQVSPMPGSAVLFWDFVPTGDMYQPGELATPDPTSQHGGCPVLAGEKLIATRWVRASKFT